MSLNILISASTPTTFHLEGGKSVTSETVRDFKVWQTPTAVTEALLRKESEGVEAQIAAYKAWALSVGNEPAGGWVWDEGDPTVDLAWKGGEQVIVGNTVRPDTRTVGEAHVAEFEKWLAAHNGWKVSFDYT